jgi:hypothetical protein
MVSRPSLTRLRRNKELHFISFHSIFLLRVSDLTKEVVDVDGNDVDAFVVECRCGGNFVLTSDTVDETRRFVDKWNVDCDTCSLQLVVANK